ncbi:MAG: hypothetical protein AAF327_09725 [Cyanobacteria bacterium P01_A01_bin.37]
MQLQSFMNLELRDRKVGAIFLGKGNDLGAKKFIFGFKCRGIHTTLKDDQKSPVFDAIEAGLKDIPKGETLTIHLSSFSRCDDRLQEIERLFKGTNVPQLQFLLKGEHERIKELRSEGKYKPKTLNIFVSFTLEGSHEKAGDITEKLIKFVADQWNKTTGEFDSLMVEAVHQAAIAAFTDGFQVWEQLLSTKMDLDVKPMTVEELWETSWYRMNRKECPAVPQIVTITEEEVTEDIRVQIHPTTFIAQNCPTSDPEWVLVNNRYVGALVFEGKPSGWKSKFDELRYIWEIIGRESVRDIEVFCEISRASEEIMKTNMQRLTKQTTVAMEHSASLKSVDVGATLKQQKTIKAQESLYEGAVPLNVATVFLIHRESPDSLDEASRFIESCIRQPAYIVRETNYAWKIWLQTTKLTWWGIMQNPFDRRTIYLSSEAPGFMSLIVPRSMDKTGFELISEEGGTPIRLDLFRQHRNLGIFATTRAGKSVMVSGILTQALAQDMPIVALDFPKPDGSSTFTDYTKFMGKRGAYFDIGKEANNLFELPNLSHLDEETQKERFQDYLSFLESALLTMVLGSENKSAAYKNRVRALIVLMLDAFFKDQAIMKRYNAAIAKGLGTPEWEKTPTLNDFLDFCDIERLKKSDEINDETRSAMGEIFLQLEFWCTHSVGRAVSAPSSFPTNAPLLVFALRNLNNENDAAVLALSAYSAALRRALSSPASIFFIDESPILFQFDEIAALVARLCANGAKAGVRVILSAQDPDTIAKSPSASKILQNLSTRLVGRIQPNAINSFVQYLDYPREIIGRNATDSFFPKREGIYSQWLLDDSGIYTYSRFYASYLQLAAVANNPDEQEVRRAYMSLYPNKYDALSHFAQELVAALRDNRKLRLPDSPTVATATKAG